MKQLNPYLNLRGQCRQAFEFYKGCFGAAEVSFLTFRDASGEEPMDEVSEDAMDGVIHAELKWGDILIMGSDGWPDAPFTRASLMAHQVAQKRSHGSPAAQSTRGGNISLNIALAETAEPDRLFDALSQGGKVTVPLHEAFWGGRFGMLTDKFGIQWMLNVHRG